MSVVMRAARWRLRKDLWRISALYEIGQGGGLRFAPGFYGQICDPNMSSNPNTSAAFGPKTAEDARGYWRLLSKINLVTPFPFVATLRQAQDKRHVDHEWATEYQPLATSTPNICPCL